MKNVAVIGASNKEERYSNLAMKMLEQYGYRPIPVTPLTDTVCGHPTRASITDITESGIPPNALCFQRTLRNAQNPNRKENR